MKLVAFYSKNEQILFAREVKDVNEALYFAGHSPRATTLQIYRIVKPFLQEQKKVLVVQYNKDPHSFHWIEFYKEKPNYIMGCIK